MSTPVGLRLHYLATSLRHYLATSLRYYLTTPLPHYLTTSLPHAPPPLPPIASAAVLLRPSRASQREVDVRCIHVHVHTHA